VTCDVTPHHLALTDEWIAGARRFAWEAGADATRGGTSAIVAAPYATSLRVNPPLRTPADALACLAALADGTADAIATDHAPAHRGRQDGRVRDGGERDHRDRDGARARLLAVDAGRLTLPRAIEVLTTGPAAVIGRQRGLVEGAPADLVVFDRSDGWTVTADALLSKGKHSPLLGMELPGRVLLTLAGGRVAHEAPALVAV
jgi:dihydroorotase